MKTKKWKKASIIISFLALAAIALSGCSGGSDGAAGVAGATGDTGAIGPPGPTGPAGGTNASTMTVAELGAALESSTVTLDSVTIASPPVVNFTVKDANGNGITGLNAYNTSAVPGLEYIRFNIAKLVPGTNGSPSKWVNYIVTTTATPPVATPPTSDREGTLVDNGGGSYTYTFYRDLAKIKDTAGVEDVTYEPTLTHRLIVIVTPPEPDPPAKFWRCTNTVFDFTIDPTTKAAIPLTATSTLRDITTTARCNSCHTDISKMFMNNAYNDGHHFDTRPDVRNCILCHNDQQRIGVKSATSVNGVFAPNPAGTNRRLTPRIGDGEVMFDFPIMIHKLHMGENLAKKGYDFDGVKFNEKVYTQEIINCRKCHSGDTAAELAAAPQGNNWKEKPSRLACGSCHDYIKWSDGTDYRGAGFPGHPGIGGAQADDSLCVLCHKPAYIELVHTSVNATPNNPSVPAGAANFTYEISSVTVSATNQPVVTFRILNGTTPVVFNTYTGTTDAAAWAFVRDGLLTNFAGSPSFLVAYADGQDAVASADMVDFNNLGKSAAQPARVSIAELATGASGTLAVAPATAPAGSYVATLNQQVNRVFATGAVANAWGPGTTPNISALFPATAKMRTVAMDGYFTQTNLTAYPFTVRTMGAYYPSSTPAGLARHAKMVMKSVGETATAAGESRRHVVNSDKCATCHEYFEGHGGNRNYNMDGCTVCHLPNLSSSGRAVEFTSTATASKGQIVPEAAQNLKDMIHGIHGADKRTSAYPYKHSRGKAGSQTIYDWSTVEYPGSYKNCEMCHIAGTYGSVPSKALATANVTTSNAAATYNAATSVVTDALATVDTFGGTTSSATVPSGGKYISVRGTVTTARDTLPNLTDLVISPYAAACVSCHTSDAARAHMETNGGKVNKARSIFTPAAEACATCHGAGKSEGVDVVHE